MQSTSKSIGRQIRERVLVIECAVIMVGTSGTLRYYGFQTVRRVLMLWAKTVGPLFEPLEAQTVLQKTERVALRLRGLPTCLAVALTAEALMKQHGHDSVLCLGAKREHGTFSAHAWLETDDSVVIGGPKELTLEYSRFPEIPI